MEHTQGGAGMRRRRGPGSRFISGDMKWSSVLLLALASAVLTSVFLLVPYFRGTSFERMGVHAEAWIPFAVWIMARCRRPSGAACRVFVFFLVSQPLIYLIQVPFSAAGWRLFGYYRYWFLLTLLTFPAAWVGWYLNRKDLVSLLILAPVLAFLAYTAFDAGSACLRRFPRLLITVLLCLAQIVFYVYAFLPARIHRVIAFLTALGVILVCAFAVPQVNLTSSEMLPGAPSLSSGAAVTVSDPSVAEVTIQDPEEGIISVRARKYGTVFLTVRDGEQESLYELEICDDHGVTRVGITRAE